MYYPTWCNNPETYHLNSWAVGDISLSAQRTELPQSVVCRD